MATLLYRDKGCKPEGRSGVCTVDSNWSLDVQKKFSPEPANWLILLCYLEEFDKLLSIQCHSLLGTWTWILHCTSHTKQIFQKTYLYPLIELSRTDRHHKFFFRIWWGRAWVRKTRSSPPSWETEHDDHHDHEGNLIYFKSLLCTCHLETCCPPCTKSELE